MGYNTVSDNAYHALLETYISTLNMHYETTKNKEGDLKINLFLTIEFTDRNYEYAMNILNGLLTHFNGHNRMALSRTMHRASSECFHSVSEDVLHYHGLHLAQFWNV